MDPPASLPKLPRPLCLAAAWGWTLLAGGGGLALLVMRGPLPLTNGWFALLSGICACPLTAWLLRRHGRVEVSGRAQFLAAAVLFLAGRVALVVQAAAPPATSSSGFWGTLL